jgi:ribonuclease P protein component
MLPARFRMRSSGEFSMVTRHGRRIRAGDLVVYLYPAAAGSTGGGHSAGSAGAGVGQPPAVTKIGLIVGRTVGGSVVRHQVSRRLRAQLAGMLDRIPPGSRVVVRALPSAATARSQTLGRDLGTAVGRLTSGPRR